MLVVGVQDRAKLSGYEKSRKHRKAEEYIGDGIGIQIMSEDDFLAMIIPFANNETIKNLAAACRCVHADAKLMELEGIR